MYVKINVVAELRKFLAGQPTKADPAVLLCIVGSRYLEIRREGGCQ